MYSYKFTRSNYYYYTTRNEGRTQFDEQFYEIVFLKDRLK